MFDYIVYLYAHDIDNTVKTRVKEPATLQVSLTRFLYMGYSIRNAAVQVSKSVIILFRVFMCFFCSH